MNTGTTELAMLKRKFNRKIALLCGLWDMFLLRSPQPTQAYKCRRALYATAIYVDESLKKESSCTKISITSQC